MYQIKIVAQIIGYFYWVNWVIQIKKTLISVNEVCEAKQRLRDVKHDNIEKSITKVFLLNLKIGCKGTDWRDKVLSRVPLKLRECISDSMETDDEQIWRRQNQRQNRVTGT